MKKCHKIINKREIIINQDKFTYIYFNNNIFQKLSNEAVPPKRKINIRNARNLSNIAKEDIITNTKIDNNTVSTINNAQNDIISFNEKKISFEEIYDDDELDDISYNNYIQNRKNDFQRNNYLDYKRREHILLKIKNVFSKENENNFLDDYSYKRQRKKSHLSEPDDIYKERLNNFLSNFDNNIKINRFNTYPRYISTNDKNNKNDTAKNSKFLKFFDEQSNFVGNEGFFQPNNSRISKNNNNFEENKNSELVVIKHRKRNSDDLISEDDDPFNRNKYRKRNFLNDKTRLKTENGDSVKKRMKRNFIYSLNSENRNLRTSLLDANNSKLKLINRKNKGEKENDKKELSNSHSQLDDSPEKSFCLFYFKYFINREIFFASFYEKNDDNIPGFIRIPTLILAITFIFTINCLFLTTNYIHKRYVYAKNHNKINEFKYLFAHEFGKSFYCALIGNIFKMLCIKLIYGFLFKVSSKEFNNLDEQKKEEYLTKYRKKSIIYFIIVFIFVIVFWYISINYIGTFHYTKIGILLGFILSVILSFILCGLFCLIIVFIYFLGKKYNINFFIFCYKWMEKIY